MTTALFTRLILPLVLAFGTALALHHVYNFDGFFLNLATELIGILITISYVDWILRRHEKERWDATDTRIADRLRILLNVTLSGIRRGVGFGAWILGDETVLRTYDPLQMHKHLLNVAEQRIKPALWQRIRGLDEEGWRQLAHSVKDSYNATTSFLQFFQARLSPDQISDFLDMQQALLSSLTLYETFPDVVGVETPSVPAGATPPEVLQQAACESAVKQLSTVIALAKKLSISVDTAEK